MITTFNKMKQALLRLRNYMIQDKLVTICVGDFALQAPRSHALPRYLKIPTYSRNFPRLVAHVAKHESSPLVLDIGANIGDTVALVQSVTRARFVCIEGDELFYSLLVKNTKQFPNVTTYKVLLADTNCDVHKRLKTESGTAAVVSGDTTINLQTLDTFASAHSDLLINPRIIKIDTDGYDTKIIRGATRFLAKHKPILFFELDRYFLEEQHENAMDTFTALAAIGYNLVMFYDNLGRFLVALSISETEHIAQLYQYTYLKRGAFRYYDVCVFHRDDDKIANGFIETESIVL